VKQLTLLLGLFFAMPTAFAQKIVVQIIEEGKENQLEIKHIELEKNDITFNYKSFNQKKVTVKNTGRTQVIESVIFPVVLSVSKKGYEIFEKTYQKKDNVNGILITLQKEKKTIGEVIITGQNKPVLEQQSIYKVTSITAKEIAKRGANSLNDVLKNELNYYVSNDNILGSSVNVGGVGGQNVKILINGVPIVGRENGNIDLSQINLHNVKRIETIEGPMSVLYGSNALGGVINIITNSPSTKRSASLNTYMESIGKVNVNASVQMDYKKHKFLFSQARNFFNGWTPKDVADTFGRYQLWKPKTQYVSDLQYATKLGKTSIQNNISFVNDEIVNKGTPTINAFEGYAFDEYYNTTRFSNSLSIQKEIDSNSTIAFTNTYSNYFRTRNRFKKDLVTLKQIQTLGVGDQDTTRNGELNLRGTYTNTYYKKLSVLSGYEYNYQQLSSYKLRNQKQHQHDLGIYQSITYKLAKLSIQPSARLSLYNNYKPQVTPALHLKYDVKNNTTLRTSYARGFRIPSLKELYLQFIDQNHTILGNSELLPEKSHHLEASLEHNTLIKNNKVQLKTTLYYNDINNMITLAIFNNHGILREYINIERYKNLTFNTSAKVTVKKLSVFVASGVTRIVPFVESKAHYLKEITSSVSYAFTDNLSIQAYYKFNSSMPIIGINSGYYYTKAIHIGDASVSNYFLKKKLYAQIGIKNIFNVQQANLSSDANAVQNTGHSSTSSSIFPERSGFVSLGWKF
jgi:outer membrane receptor for ferrienterochelin and colicins